MKNEGCLTKVRLGEGLNDIELKQCKSVIAEFGEVFEPLNGKPADLPKYYVKLVDGAKPFRAKYRSFGASKQRFFEDEIALWRNLNLIEPCLDSEWAAAPVITLKHSGDYRLCYDFGPLNKYTVRNANSPPHVPDFLTFVSGKRYKACFDMARGYHQIPLDESSRDLMAINAPAGLYRPTRLMFGVTNGPCFLSSSNIRIVGTNEKCCTKFH